MNRVEEMQAFVAVVDFKSFSKAGDKLGVAKSMLSRRVSELEKRLGVQLMQRTTRRQSLTDAGREFYQRSTQILADLEEAEQVVSDSQCEISGRIRLALPIGFGVSQLAGPITEFMKLHPRVRIDIDLNDRKVDLLEENVDLAIRIGDLEDSSLIARRLANVHFMVCASPAYLEQHGAPRHPSELSNHEVLIYTNVPAGRQWSYSLGGKQINPRTKYRLSANNGEFLAAAASAGLAIVNGPKAFLEGRVSTGELVEILVDYPLPEVGMYAVFPPGRLISQRVRALSDSLHVHFLDRSI